MERISYKVSALSASACWVTDIYPQLKEYLIQSDDEEYIFAYSLEQAIKIINDAIGSFLHTSPNFGDTYIVKVFHSDNGTLFEIVIYDDYNE